MRSPSPPEDSGPAYGVDDVLHAEQVRRLAHVAALRRAMGDLVAASEASNADDEHDPEGATIAFERSQLGAQLEAAQAALADVGQAQARLEAGTYGTCQSCGLTITPERLEARPTAATCIGCAG